MGTKGPKWRDRRSLTPNSGGGRDVVWRHAAARFRGCRARPLFGPTLHVTKVKESHLTEMSGSSESLEFIGRGRSPQRGKEASFYDAKRVERCFFSRRGGHRPEEEWAFYWQKKPPFSGPSGDPEKVMPKSPQRPTPSRSNETTAVCHFGPTQFKSTHPPQP